MGTILAPILFVFTNDPKARTQCTFSNLTDNTTRAVADTLEDRAAIQRYPGKAGENGPNCLLQWHTDSHMWDGIPPHTRRGWHLLARQLFWGKGTEGPGEQKTGHRSAVGPVAEEYDKRWQTQVVTWKSDLGYIETFSSPLSNVGTGCPERIWHLHV